MKGLLIKDLRILMCQKSALFIYIGVSLFMLINGVDISFCLGYTIMLMTILLLGSISYDEHENGMSFLMTLPVSRKEYVFSKYCFVVTGVVFADFIMLLAVCGYESIKPSGFGIKNYVIISLIMLVMAFVLLSLMLPIHLKFGVEKSRFVWLAILGIVGTIIVIFARFSEHIVYDIQRFLEKITVAAPEMVMLILGGVSLLALLISVWISVRIIEKRDY